LLAGPRGCGKRTLAQRSVAAASRDGTVAYVDFPSRLDPEFLSRFDARLDQLLVVRPTSLREGMASVRVLARAGVDLVCIDLSRTRSAGLDAELPHLLHRAAEADCTLLLVQDAEADDAIRYYASLILSFERSAWVFRRDGDLEGLRVDAAVVKNRLAPPGLKKQWIVPYPIP
jgi:RecA/RadA recombinase